ncbi:MAG: thiamine pyrophosphate-dependent enzyme [Acidimicrobiales bacterium]
MAQKVADDLWDMLVQAGVKRCYGIVGDALNPVIAALSRRDDIEFVHVRHEEWGAFAASAEAFLTGEPVAVCGTAGPGIVHLVNGLLDAFHERCPVIAVAGDIETSVMDLAPIEGINPKDLFQTASLWTGRVVNPHQARGVFSEAIRTAILDRGPTVIAIPGDIASADSPGGPIDLVVPTVPWPQPAEADLRAIADLVNAAGKVTVFGGDGCRDAGADVVALARKLKAPVGFSLKGKPWLEAGNPNAVGMTGLLGYGGCFHAVKEADLVLMLGTDFPFPDFLEAGGAKVVQVDDNAIRLGRRTPIAAGSVADVGAFVRALTPLVDERDDDTHLNRSLEISRDWVGRLNVYVDGGDKRSPIRPEYVAATLNELMDDDAIVTVDTGTPVMWASHHIEFGGDRRMFGSFSWASMASASPNAFGAAKAYPGRQVVAMCGDGGFSMLAFGDLITEVQHNARIVHVVFNNGALDFVEIEQQEVGLVPYGTDLPNPNFAAIAHAFGAMGIRVEDPAEVRSAITEALAHTDGPVVLDMVTDRSALALPSHVPAKTAEGFTLSLARRVLKGDIGDVITTARDNYRLLKP